MEGKTKTAEEIISIFNSLINDFNTVPDFLHQDWESEYFLRIENIIEQERHKAVKEFKEMIIKELNYYGHPSAVQIINDLIEKLK